MASSRSHISVSTTQGTPSLSSSLLPSSSSYTGSVPIRAPVTLDDDSSDIESNGHNETDNSDSNSTSGSIDNGFESEGFESAEEFETASERPFVGDPDEESQESGSVDKYELSRPFVANPDEESLENCIEEEEESGVTDEYSPVDELDSPNSKVVRPIAQLSLDDDEFDEVVGDMEVLSEGEAGRRFSGIAEDASFGALDRFNSAPVVNLLGVEDDKEDELLVETVSSVVHQSELSLVRDGENLVLASKFLGADTGVLGSKDDVVVVKDSANESVLVELLQDEGHFDTPVALVEASVEREHVLEENPEAEDFGNSASVKFAEDGEAPVGHVESWVESRKDVLEENLKLEEDVKHVAEERLQLENLEQEKIELNGDGNTVETVINPVDETVETIVPELQGLKVEGVDVEADKPMDCHNNEHGSVTSGNVALEKVSYCEKLDVKTRPETEVGYELPAPKEAIIVESIDTSLTSEMQTIDSLENGGLCGILEAGRLEDAWQSNSNSLGIRDEANCDSQKIGGRQGLVSDEDIEGLIFRGSGTTRHIMKELEQSFIPSSFSGAEGSQAQPQRIDRQTNADSDEVEAYKEHEEKRLFDPAALAALLKVAASAESQVGSVTITSTDASREVSLKRPAGSDSSFCTMIPGPASDMAADVINDSFSEKEKKIIEKIQHVRVKFLRLVQRLGRHSPEDFMVAQVLHRLVLAAGGHVCPEFSIESAKQMAMQLEAEGRDDLDFALNILVLGKTGVGKSATVNSIFGEKKVISDAFEPATTRVKEIVGTIDGVKIRILDTPGLRSSVKEEAINRKILASVKKFTKKFPPDVVLYVDRLDTHGRDLNDLPLLSSLTSSLTASIWQNAIVTLTHAASPPPDGPSGSPVSFEVFVAQRSHVVQQAISQAVGDLRLMHPSMMHPVSLVENHPLCQKNEHGENVLPNGQSWRPELLLLCYSLKILSEASSISRSQHPSNHKKLFGFQHRFLPLPHLLSSLLQSRPHPKLTVGQGGDNIDVDIELLDLSDSNEEDEDEYDQLPPFRPLRKSQIDKLSKEQRKAYFEEYDYRVKLLQRKQWREELKKMKYIKKFGKESRNDFGYVEEDVNQEDAGPATVPVAMPDFVLPPSFDSDNPSYRYRFLEPSSELLVRPVLDSQGWDHDCGYDGLSLEGNAAIAGRFPGAFAVQITKDKKEFNIHLDSSICAKHRENGSTMVGFDIQTVGRQLAYILRSETKFKNFKINKTSTGLSMTLLGKNIATGLKIEDQIAVGKRLAVVGSAGAVRSEGDTAYGANLEVCLKSKDFPIEQDQSTLGLSLMKWRDDLSLMANLQSQFFVGRNSKVAIHVGMNNKCSGQIIIKTSSSDLQIVLLGIVPVVMSIFRSIYPGRAARKLNMLDY